MTAKSIDWDHLSRQGHYCAQKMARFLYPDDSARKTFNRAKFVLRSLLYRQQLSRVFELFQAEPLKALPAHYPELLDKPMRPYRFAGSTATERAEMLENHYRLMLARYPDLIDPLYLGDGIELGRYPESGCRIVLRHDGTFRREAELAKNGFMPLLHKKNTDFAAFIGAQSLQKPAEYDDPDATANANLAARLPYLFATCRFAHYLKCIVRDKIGSFKEKDEMQRWLQDWILNYVDGDPAHSTEPPKAQHPLAAAEVVVEEVEGNPGYYNSKFFLRPHYQLEGLTVSLRLVSKLPSAKEA